MVGVADLSKHASGHKGANNPNDPVLGGILSGTSDNRISGT